MAGFVKYNTYSFVEKDPVIDVLRTMKRTTEMKDSELAHLSNVSVSTIRNWFGGRTRRPQFATVAAAAVAMGYEVVPLTSDGRKKLKGH